MLTAVDNNNYEGEGGREGGEGGREGEERRGEERRGEERENSICTSVYFSGGICGMVIYITIISRAAITHW